MKVLKSDKYIWQILLGTFFLSGFFHVIFYGVPYTDSIVQIFGGTVVLFWMAAILRRIVDKRVRLYLVWIAGLMMGYFALQMSKYKLFTDHVDAQRYVWYGFYLPMILMPLFLLFLALFMNHQEEEPYRKKWFLFLFPAIFLIAAVLTNDLHFLVFRFPDGLTDTTGMTGTYQYGPIYYLVIAWEILMVLASVVIILKKCGTSVAKKYFWMPAGTLLTGVLLMFLVVFGLAPKIHGVTVWQLTEIYAYTVMLFLEGCIRIGMIPANTGYEKMFSLLHMPAAIYDPEGKETVTSASPIPEQDYNQKIEHMPIYGGQVLWAVDLTEVNSLNQQIMDVTSQIQSRNDRLLSENQMKEEQASLDARNRLYDQIAEIVKPQLHQIEHLLDHEVYTDFHATIAKINVLNAYIKRRSNMELLKADTGSLPVSEMILAVRESMEYLKDTGTDNAVSASSREDLPAELVICAYELFERVLETCLGTARMAAVFITCRNQVIRIRFMIQNKPDFPYHSPLLTETIHETGILGSMDEERTMDERIITIILQEGGIS